MEVRIVSYTEKLDGTRRMINRAYFVMVATDENQHPIQVPGLIVEGINEKIEWEAAQKRQELRKQRQREGF